MKIVSKRKDYFDWVVLETDPRKIFIRHLKPLEREDIEQMALNIYGDHQARLHFLGVSELYRDRDIHLYSGNVWFCDKKYPYVFHQEALEYYYSLADVPSELLKKYPLVPARKKFRGHFSGPFAYLVKNRKMPLARYADKEVDINTKIGYAIVFGGHEFFGDIIVNGLLKDVQFYKVMTASQAYTELYNWIPYPEPALPGGPDDMIRYVGKGFDIRTSFRQTLPKG